MSFPISNFIPLYISKTFFISSRLSILLACNSSWYSLMILCISVLSIVPSFPFLILFIWALSFSLISLKKGLSVLLKFLKNQFLILIILKFIWKPKWPQIAKTVFRKKNRARAMTLPDLRLYCKATITKTILHWCRNWHMDKWNRIAQK